MRSLRIIPLITALVASASLAAKPVLKVNDTQLTDTDLKLAEQLVTQQMQAQMPGTSLGQDMTMRHAVDQLIGRTLLLQAARDAKTTVDPVELAAQVDQQKTRRGAEGFQKLLTELGLTEQEFTKRIEDQMVVRKFVESNLAAKINVTDQDAKAYYDSNPTKFEHPEEVRIRGIMLKLDPKADEKQAADVKTRADLTRKRIVLGEEMANVAKEVSDDPTKTRGGEIGWVRKGMLLPELEPAVWALKPGEVSEVLKSQYGYHIFKLEERRAPGKLSFDEVKGRLTGIIKNERLGNSIEELVKERRAKAKIEALDPAVKTALEPLPTPKPGNTPANQPQPNAPKKP